MSYKTALKELILWFLVILAILSIGRILLFFTYYERVVTSGVEWWWTFFYGLRMDSIVASILSVFPALVMFTFPSFLKRAGVGFLKYYYFAVLMLVIYIENATFPFIAEFDVRPNEIFINYLDYPKEVFGNIWASYKLELFVSFSMMAYVGYRYFLFVRGRFEPIFEEGYFKKLLLLLPVAAVLFLGIRSSIGWRPANISDAVYTSNHLVNEITKTSLYSIGYAYYSQKKHSTNVKSLYGELPLSESVKIVKEHLDINSTGEIAPFLRVEKTHFKAQRPKNLVLFLQESLGAQFVGALGDKRGLTPNFDKLSKEGILFSDLYSNGTRSVRGIAGIVAGFLPVPGKGVVKRNRSQSDFFTVASLLKPYGYYASFIYGGEKRFDNMASWFYGNGFDEIIDENRFDNPKFKGIWGVCDEDLVDRANEEFEKLYKQNKPFVSVMFSTTNHTPFEYPDGRIELYKGAPKASVENAIKFADYAIGKLIADAKKLSYYKDTIFVIVADHNVRVYGDDLVPVNMFHIPALIVGGGVEPLHVDKLTTQPDVLATALDLIGIDLEHPVLGKSIFTNSKKDTAFMQFHDMFALRLGNKIAIIQPGIEPLTFVYENEHLSEIEHDKKLEHDLRAFITVINYLYSNKKHTIIKNVK